MTTRVLAHFDGKVIVPDEPVDLPVGEPLELDLRRLTGTGPLPTPEERRAVLRELVAQAIPGLNIPDEALRRESIYD